MMSLMIITTQILCFGILCGIWSLERILTELLMPIIVVD